MYDRELLAVFSSIGHFRNQLKGRTFIILIDYIPLQYTFSNPSEKPSPWVIRQLQFISQFTMDALATRTSDGQLCALI